MEKKELFEQLTFIAGNADACCAVRENAPLVPFSEEVMAFLSDCSKKLFEKRSAYRGMPDVAALAFWLRSGHLNQLKQLYGTKELRIGKRVSVHFAPSNIPLLFVYTMAAGLLAGNSVIVRLPGKDSAQEAIVTGVIRELLADEHAALAGRIILCRYPHDSRITDALSDLCDVRVIWGADASVNAIRRSPLPPRAVEIPFAGRRSAAAFDAQAVLDTEDLSGLYHDFFNDTFLNDQNACSSPHLLFWQGDEKTAKKARSRFFDGFAEYMKQTGYEVGASVAVAKLDAALQLAAVYPNAQITTHDNVITRVFLSDADTGIWEKCVPGGFFIEMRGETPEKLLALTDETVQTLTVYGISAEEITQELIRFRSAGIDRIVPVGHSLDFELTWDGFDLIEAMSRRIRIMQ